MVMDLLKKRNELVFSGYSQLSIELGILTQVISFILTTTPKYDIIVPILQVRKQ